MQIDLLTLYHLIIGTLLVAAAMTFWECRAHPHRARELGIWAASYAVFALGGLVSIHRGQFPGIGGWALANLLMMLGYLCVLHGAARLDGRGWARASAAGLAAIALVWAVGGERHANLFWNHLTALPIALVCGLTAWAVMSSGATRGLRSRTVAAAIFACHGLFYLLRGLATPTLVDIYGPGLLPVFAKATMYEGVLYSVAMPMVLLSLVREEAQRALLLSSRTDHLTGLGNRLGFFERGEAAIAGCGSSGAVCLLAFDLDHFKAINDRYGHAAGDEILVLFARAAQEVAGDDAVLGRLGGEEFAALLPGRDAAAARRVGQDIALAFSEKAARREGLAIPATVSIGLASRAPGRGDLSALLSLADRALYRAKAQGRNRVETAEALVAAAA